MSILTCSSLCTESPFSVSQPPPLCILVHHLILLTCMEAASIHLHLPDQNLPKLMSKSPKPTLLQSHLLFPDLFSHIFELLRLLVWFSSSARLVSAGNNFSPIPPSWVTNENMGHHQIPELACAHLFNKSFLYKSKFEFQATFLASRIL